MNAEGVRTYISEKTWIPISAVVVVFLAAAWLTTLFVNVQQLKTAQSSFDARLSILEAQNSANADRMARIETKIDFLIESTKKP